MEDTVLDHEHLKEGMDRDLEWEQTCQQCNEHTDVRTPACTGVVKTMIWMKSCQFCLGQGLERWFVQIHICGHNVISSMSCYTNIKIKIITLWCIRLFVNINFVLSCLYFISFQESCLYSDSVLFKDSWYHICKQASDAYQQLDLIIFQPIMVI